LFAPIHPEGAGSTGSVIDLKNLIFLAPNCPCNHSLRGTIFSELDKTSNQSIELDWTVSSTELKKGKAWTPEETQSLEDYINGLHVDPGRYTSLNKALKDLLKDDSSPLKTRSLPSLRRKYMICTRQKKSTYSFSTWG